MTFKVIIPASLGGDLVASAGQFIRKVVFDIQARIIDLMRAPKSGKLYGRHQASAPGEAPAIDTGFLVNSIQPSFPSRLVGVLTVGAEYAGILETVLNRPFVAPAIRGVLDELNSL